MTGVKIIPMGEEHIETLADMEKLCFSDPWSPNAFLTELLNKNARFFVAIQGRKAVGYIGMHSVVGEGYITNVAVHPDCRRQGIGICLLTRLMEQAEEEDLVFVTLEVRPSNQSAIALYERFGFEPVGLRKNYYRKPVEDGLLMTCYLDKNR